MWRVVAIVALSLSGCVSTKSFDQAFGAGQGRRIINVEVAYFMASPLVARDHLEGQVSSPRPASAGPPARGEYEPELPNRVD
jgi:outer membrane lipoprotein SlyB